MANVIRKLLASLEFWQPGPPPPSPARDRSEAVDAAGRESLVRTLGHAIALDAARDTIFRHASVRPGVIEVPDQCWDTNHTDPSDADTQFRVNRAATFLDICGLLARAPGAPHIVRIRAEIFPL